MLKGTSKNRSYSSDATKLSANDSASFPFRFMDVHARAARDPHREQFFEVPLSLMRAFLVVNCQSALVWLALRSCSQAAISSTRICLLGMRRLSSDSAKSSQL